MCLHFSFVHSIEIFKRGHLNRQCSTRGRRDCYISRPRALILRFCCEDQMKILLCCQLLTSLLLHLTAADAFDGDGEEGLAAPGPEVVWFDTLRTERLDKDMERVHNTGIMRSRAVNKILRKFYIIRRTPSTF